MISCKHATELISKAMEEPLTFKEKCLLEIHLFICEFCEQFKTQITVLRKALSGSKDEVTEDDQSVKLPQSTKEKIKAEIRKRFG